LPSFPTSVLIDVAKVIVPASFLVPPTVAWLTSRSGQPFLSWSAHPWVFFWCSPFVPLLLGLPALLIWREAIPLVVAAALAGLWFVGTAVMTLSAVQGLRLAHRQSRWRTILVLIFVMAGGTFVFVLGGGQPFVTGSITDGRAMVFSLLFGALFAGWFALMALASELAVRWLASKTRGAA